MDSVSRAHDARYFVAQNAKSKNDQARQVRNADKKMVRAAKKIGRDGTDNPINIAQGKRLIQAKMALEDRKVFSKGSFGGELKTQSPEELALMKKAIDRGELKGYGFAKPGDELKLKMIKQLSKGKGQKGKGSEMPAGASASKTLPDTQDFKLEGSEDLVGGRFVTMAGGQGKLMDFVTSTVVPKLLKLSGISTAVLPPKLVNNIIGKTIKLVKGELTLPKLVSTLTKTLVPVFLKSKLKTLGKDMSGKGLGSLKNKLSSSLSKALMSVFKGFVNFVQKKKVFKGKGVMSGGSIQAGGQFMIGSGVFGDFFKILKKGVKVIGKPLLNLGADVLPIVFPGVGGVVGSVVAKEVVKHL